MAPAADHSAARRPGQRLRFPRERDVRCHTAGELVHPVVAGHMAGGVLVMGGARQAAVVDRRRPTPASRDDVIDLEAQGRAADASGIERPLALSLVARPHLPPHRGGDVARVLRRAGGLLRPLDHPSALGLPGQQEVERRLDDLLRRGARLGVPLTLSRGLELLDELLRDGHVKTAKVLGEQNGLRRGRGRREPGRTPGRVVFNHMKRDIRVAPR